MTDKPDDMPKNSENPVPENSNSFVLAKLEEFHIGAVCTFGLKKEEAIGFYEKTKHLHHKQPVEYTLIIPSKSQK